MWWMWILGPIAVAVIFFLTIPGRKSDAFRERELQRFLRRLHPPAPDGDPYRAPSPKKKGKPAAKKPEPAWEPPRTVKSLPAELQGALGALGGGVVDYRHVLVPGLGYLVGAHADATSGSDWQAVVATLEAPAPAFTVRPLAIVEGGREPNDGVRFAKHPEFMAEMHVAGADPKAIGRFLSRTLREAILDRPDAWVFVRGRTMVVALYGRADADDLESLVTVADVLFAEHGADGGPSLLDGSGAEPPLPAPAEAAVPKKKPKKKKTAAAAAAPTSGGAPAA